MSEDDAEHQQRMLEYIKRKRASILISRLHRYINSMTPHQKEREAVQLLIEATSAIENLIDEGGEQDATDENRQEGAR